MPTRKRVVYQGYLPRRSKWWHAGANRLGGNSLSDLLVFGQLAGVGAASYAKSLPTTLKVPDDQIQSAIDELEAPFDGDRNVNPYDLQKNSILL